MSEKRLDCKLSENPVCQPPKRAQRFVAIYKLFDGFSWTNAQNKDKITQTRVKMNLDF